MYLVRTCVHVNVHVVKVGVSFPPCSIYIQVVINLGHMTFESVSDWSFDSERMEPEEDDLDIDDDGNNKLIFG